LVVVWANLYPRWFSFAPVRRRRATDPDPGGPKGRAAGVASGLCFLLAGLGLMTLSVGGPATWTWWIGVGTATHGGLIMLTRVRGLRDFGPWG
jgi:hypothetical protein